MGRIMEVGRRQRAPQIQPNYGRNQFFPQLVTEKIIGEQESNRALKGMKRSLPINDTDAGKKILQIQRALNNEARSKAARPLLDGGKGEHSVNIKFHQENRRRPKRHVSTVECVGVTRIRV